MSDDESADDETRPGGSGATDLSPPEERGLPSFDEEDEVDETDIDDDLFEEMDVEGSPGDAGAWEALTEGEVATESPEDIDGEVRTISDRTCHGCRFFADPPETACTHSGTEINRVVDTDHFEVVDCPMAVTAIDVATDETADGRLDSPETGDVDDAEVGAIDQGSTDESADPVDDTNGLIDIRDTTTHDTAGDATAVDAPESVDSEWKSGGEPAAPDESRGDAADDLPDESDEDVHAVDEPSDGGSLTGDDTSTASDGTTSGSEDGDDRFADPADSTRNDVDESDAERESDTVDGADDPADMDDLRDVDDGEDVDEPGEERVEVERDRDDATDPADTASDSAGESVAPDEISWGDADEDDDPDGDADEDDDLSIDWANDDE